MFPFSLAVRFLKAGKGQTILIIAGIAIAVSAQIFVGLLIGSLQQTLVDRAVGNQPQVTILPAGEQAVIREPAGLLQNISQSGLVELVAETATGPAFIGDDARSRPIVVKGIDENGVKIYRLDEAVYAGEFQPSGEGVLIGRDLSEEYGYAAGDSITVSAQSGEPVTYRVAGLFDLRVTQLNSTWVITTLEAAQELFGYGSGITAIEMTVEDYFAADTIAAELEERIASTGIRTANWKSQNEQLLSGLQGQSVSSLMIQVFIIISVVIAVSAILAITVFQKSRQLGILKAMGIKDKDASLIFIYEGLLIGLIGSVAGIALGLLFIYGFSFGTSQGEGLPLIDLYIDYGFIAISWAIAVVAAVAAALIPARRSLRLNPIEVIREG